jgi:hypothetical protein
MDMTNPWAQANLSDALPRSGKAAFMIKVFCFFFSKKKTLLPVLSWPETAPCPMKT